MNTLTHQIARARSNARGFSLVEMVLALAVAAFALTSIFGLIPVGLQALRQSIELNVEAAIVQRISGIVSQSNFQNLDTLLTGTFYFDDQGTLVNQASDSVFEAVIDRPDVVSDLASAGEKWPLSTDNLKRLVVHIRYTGRAQNTGPIRTLSLHVGNSGK